MSTKEAATRIGESINGETLITVSVTETAKQIRAALKIAFPGMKFSVKTSRYSMGESITVAWVDGPTTKQVDAVTSFFQGKTSLKVDDSVDNVWHSVLTENGFAKLNYSADSVHTSRTISFDKRWAMALQMASELEIALPGVTLRDSGNHEIGGLITIAELGADWATAIRRRTSMIDYKLS